MAEKKLVQKLAEVMAAIKHVPKRGRNDFHKYDYATEADIADAVRDALATRGIMMIPSVQSVSWREVQGKNGPQAIATLLVQFELTDGVDSIKFNAVGEGQDTGDKNTYKAITGATKYALLKLFLIPTGDDPEIDDKRPEPKAVPAIATLTDEDMKKLFAVARDHGFKSKESLYPITKAVAGVESLNVFPRAKLDALLAEVKKGVPNQEVA